MPLDLYSEFRNVMHKQPLDVEAATKTYRLLVTSMPPANQYLLLYILDLLAVFARKSELNRMPASSEWLALILALSLLTVLVQTSPSSSSPASSPTRLTCRTPTNTRLP